MPLARKSFPACLAGFRAGIVTLVLALSLAGCATTGNEGEIYDPIEPVNRAMLKINIGFDVMFFRPIAITYRELVPGRIKRSIRNIFSLARKPVDLINSLLQGDIDNAGQVVAVTLINATLGIGGLFDMAGELGVKARTEDFGQTLGVWGVGTGPYLILPVLGPSNLRDAAGFGMDYTLDPLTWSLGGHFAFRDGRGLTGKAGKNASSYLAITQAISQRERFLGQFEKLEATSLDFYSALRSLSLQNRHQLIRNRQ